MSTAALDESMAAMALGKDEDRVYAEFYSHPVQDNAATIKEGRPIFKDRAYVMIMVPGDKDNIVRRPARQHDKERFARQFASYESGTEQVQDGTPLEQWPLVTRAQVEELKHFKCHTVEALASMPDTTAQKFMGINKLKAQAADYIKSAAGHAPILEIRQENDALREEMDALKAQMGAMVEELAKAKSSKKG